jgi:mannan endo-1,4-beta-mannosidase
MTTYVVDQQSPRRHFSIKNPKLTTTWPQSSPETLAKWQCTIASAIKSNLQSRTDILVSTGGASYLATSVQDAYFSCAALDVIAIHAYGVGDLTKDALQPYVQKAQKAGKKLIMQEWGMCYFDTSNNNCPKGTPLSAAARDANIKKYADSISQAGIPWMYWQIIPNADPHGYDYEVRVFLY